MSAGFRGRFDHAVILVADLARASDAFAKLGFTVSPGGAHTGLGTHNALIRFGVDYLELLAVRDEQEALRARSSTSSVVERIRSGKGGLASFALATADIERDAARFKTQGLEAVGPFAMERMRPDGHRLSWRLLVPHGESWGKPWPFFIQWDQDDATRLSWEKSGAQPNGARRVESVSVAVADLDAGAALYEQLGLRAAGEDEVATLGARRRTFATDHFAVHLCAASGTGTLADRMRTHGEGIFEITLASSGGPQVLTAEGARIVFTSDTR